MSNQIVITSGAKLRDLDDVIIGTDGILSSVAFNVANGVPRLDENGKILVSQLPNSVMEFKGVWNAATNSPTLVNGTGNAGDVWLCNVAGTVNFGAGPIAFAVGDYAVYTGTVWARSSGATGTVTSVGVSRDGNALTITGSPVTTSGTINLGFSGDNTQYINGAGNLTTFPTVINSIGLTMPAAFGVSNSPLTANGTIGVTALGFPSQYIRGDGTLADFPTSGGGGSSVSYYLNGGTSQGTIGGTTYYEMSKIANTGTMVDFSKTGNGFITAFLTDAGDPALLQIPAGNWNYEIYASMSSNGGTPQMYAELYVYNGTTFTLISTSSNEILYDGTNLNLYTFAMTVPQTVLTVTDRIAIKLYATNSGGKTTTVHTQNGHLCQVITTFTTGLTALNGLTAQVQYFGTGTSGSDFNIVSSVATHTFNIPSASATARGLITTGTQTIAGSKTITGTTTFTGGPILSDTNLTYANSGYTLVLQSPTLSVNRTVTLPNGTGTLALTSDISYPVTSVFGRTGAVVATSGDYNSDQVTEGTTNLYFTNTRARTAISLTTTGSTGASTYNNTTGVLNIPNYADQYVGTVTSVGLSAPTGFSVSGSPVTTSGTLALSFASGYSLPTNVKQSNWDDAYTWVAAFPTQTGNNGKFLTTDGSSLSWAANPLGTVTSVAMSVPTGLTVSGSPITTSGTLAVTLTAGYSIPTTANQTTWTTAYNRSLTSAAVTGTTTKTLTLNQQDGGTITASWTDINTDAVTSVFGRTGAVVATEGDYTLTQLGDVTITTPTAGQVLKYNGTAWINDTDANTGTVTSVAMTVPTGLSISGSPITSSGTLAVTLSSGYVIPTQSTLDGKVPYTGATTNVALGSNTLQVNEKIGTFDNKGIYLRGIADATHKIYYSTTGYNNAIWEFNSSILYQFYNTASPVTRFTFATNGDFTAVGAISGSNLSGTNTGDQTLAGLGGVPTSRTLTINGVGYDLSADRTWTITAGISSVSGTAPISVSTVSGAATVSISQATTTTNGYLSSTDWNTFNNKQAALTNPVTGTGNNDYIAKFTSTGSTIGNSLLQSVGTDVFINQENTSIGIDAQANIRLGFTKKTGFNPYLTYATDPFVIASSSGLNIFASNTFTKRLELSITGELSIYNFFNIINAITPAIYLDNTGRAGGAGRNWSLLSGNTAAGEFSIKDETAALTRLIIGTGGEVNTPYGLITPAVNAGTPYNLTLGTSGADAGSVTITAGSTSGYNTSIYVGAGSAAVSPNNIVFNTASVERLRIYDDGKFKFIGKVGIGITTSAWESAYFLPFEIGNTNSRGFIYGRTDSTIETGIGANAYYSSTGWKYTNTGGASTIVFAPSEILFRIVASGTANTALTWSTPLMINSSAQVLVGTTSVLQSTEQLAVSSSTNTAILAKFTGGATAGWGSKIWNNGATGDNNILEFLTETSITARGSVKYDRTNDALLLSGSNALNIATNGAIAVYVTAAQKVGIGGISTTLRMTVNDTGSTITGGDVTFATQAKGLEIWNTNSAITNNLVGVWFSTGPHKAGIASGRPDASGGWATDLRFFTHPTSTTNLDHTYETMRLGPDGTLTVTGDVVAYGSPSDLRLKTIKEKVPNALESILKLNGYRFDWKKTDHLRNYKEDIGVIAQEVAELFPELARTNIDGNMSVRYQGLTAVLIEAIKEQQKQIDELKNKK